MKRHIMLLAGIVIMYGVSFAGSSDSSIGSQDTDPGSIYNTDQQMREFTEDPNYQQTAIDKSMKNKKIKKAKKKRAQKYEEKQEGN